jgi:hypothetical protein
VGVVILERMSCRAGKAIGEAARQVDELRQAGCGLAKAVHGVSAGTQVPERLNVGGVDGEPGQVLVGELGEKEAKPISLD